MNKTRVIIPAGGLSTRMSPLSKGISKCMISLCSKPIICWIIDEIQKNFVNPEIVIVQNKNNDIKQFLEKFYKDKKDIKYVLQKEPLGPLNAIYEATKDIDTTKINDVCIWLSDTIMLDKINLDTSVIMTSEVDDWERWCMIDEKINLFDKVKNKPDTNQAIIGVYYFKNVKLFKDIVIKSNNEKQYEISYLIREYHKKEPLKIQKTESWYDCGELDSYYKSRNRLIGSLARGINNLEINPILNVIKKTGNTEEGNKKIEKEILWYKNVNNFKYFIPKIYSDTEMIMSLEPGITLSEIFLYENFSIDNWRMIFNKFFYILFNIIKNNNNYNPFLDNDSVNMFYNKPYKRIEEIKNIKEIEIKEEDIQILNKTIEEIYEILKKKNLNKFFSSEFHGDLHFGNILFETSTGKFCFLDPRGEWGNTQGCHGNILYDVAKFMQDIYLGYSHILNKNYDLINNEIVIWKNNEELEKIKYYLEESLLKYLSREEIDFCKKLSGILVCTCIPFHLDDIERANAFWKSGINFLKKYI